jgi:hypothetical protein
MHQSSLPRAADTVHALLPVVSYQGEEAVETDGQQALLQGLQVGHRERVLEFLRLVQGARPA